MPLTKKCWISVWGYKLHKPFFPIIAILVNKAPPVWPNHNDQAWLNPCSTFQYVIPVRLINETRRILLFLPPSVSHSLPEDLWTPRSERERGGPSLTSLPIIHPAMSAMWGALTSFLSQPTQAWGSNLPTSTQHCQATKPSMNWTLSQGHRRHFMRVNWAELMSRLCWEVLPRLIHIRGSPEPSTHERIRGIKLCMDLAIALLQFAPIPPF